MLIQRSHKTQKSHKSHKKSKRLPDAIIIGVKKSGTMTLGWTDQNDKHWESLGISNLTWFRHIPAIPSQDSCQGGAVVLHCQQGVQEGSETIQGRPAICQVRDRRFWERGTYLEICQRRPKNCGQNQWCLEWQWRGRDTEKEREIIFKLSFNLSSFQIDLAV